MVIPMKNPYCTPDPNFNPISSLACTSASSLKKNRPVIVEAPNLVPKTAILLCDDQLLEIAQFSDLIHP